MQSELNAMRERLALKIRENRGRRALRRLGCKMIKSRTTHGYMIVNLKAGRIEWGGSDKPGEMTIESVEEWIRA